MGWLALAAALGSAALAVVAIRLPTVEEAGPCPLASEHRLPSGRMARLCEILTETQPFSSDDWLVVRMVVPDLAAAGPEAGHGDHDWVCDRLGRPEAVDNTVRIVVQLMEPPFPRGEPSPGIRQSIEAYSLRDGLCIWELL
jgi:hypothetical protein